MVAGTGLMAGTAAGLLLSVQVALFGFRDSLGGPTPAYRWWSSAARACCWPTPDSPWPPGAFPLDGAAE